MNNTIFPNEKPILLRTYKCFCKKCGNISNTTNSNRKDLCNSCKIKSIKKI